MICAAMLFIMTHSNIKKLFENVTDPRVDRTKFHSLESILYIVLCGTMAGINTWIGCHDYAKEHADTLKEWIDLTNGIPSHDTISRVISSLDVDEFQLCFDKFIEGFKEIVTPEKAKEFNRIAIDGQSINGSGSKKNGKKNKHIVSAWSDGLKLCLGQVKTEEKSNEITAIPELLKTLDLNDQVVTIDAMGAQRDICQTILDKGGDYMISLKGNQGTLHEDVKLFFKDTDVDITNEWEERNKGHGRIEHRRCVVSHNIDFLKDHKSPGLRSIACVFSKRQTDKGIQEDVRYYISSLKSEAETIARAARSHWGIENRLHWMLDVVFKEDASTIKIDNAPVILSVMRRWALNILNQKKGNISLKRMVQKILMNPKRIVTILQQV
jgi:predicted transposase YbfD/YdcC